MDAVAEDAVAEDAAAEDAAAGEEVEDGVEEGCHHAAVG